MAVIADSASQTLVPSGRSGGKGKPSLNLAGALAGSSNPPSLGQRCTSSETGASAATRHE